MDFLGNKIDIGDYVAFARNPYADMILGKVVGITPRGFRVIRRKCNGEWDSTYIGNYSKNYEVVLSYQCVKVSYNE